MRLLETNIIARLRKTSPDAADLLEIAEEAARAVRIAIARWYGKPSVIHWTASFELTRRDLDWDDLDCTRTTCRFTIGKHGLKATVEVDLDK